jgi:hypothetical protein
VGVWRCDRYVTVGHEQKVEGMIARPCSDIDDDHLDADILKATDKALFM